MNRSVRSLGLGLGLTLAAAAACTTSDGTSVATMPTTPGRDAGVTADPDTGAAGTCVATLPTNLVLDGPSRGDAAALTADDAIAVVANRDSGTVSIFDITYPDDKPPVVTRKAEIAVGAEPWQVVIHPNGDTAFVVTKRDQKLVRIDGLKSTPRVCGETAIGSEPMSLALSPTGATAWVANFMDGTLQGVDSSTMMVKSTVDLNKALVASGLLGAEVTARPALAHPRAMVITNNGDAVEKNESILVTEFYAQTIEPMKADGSNANSSRAGLVYKVSLDSLAASVVQLPPLAKIGFVDAQGSDTGCFPNQVTAIQVQGSFAYALSTCAAPRGPIAPFPLANPKCANDAACPGAAAGSCVKASGAATGTCSTNCNADADCGANGVCQATKVCVPNFNNFRTIATPAVSVIDIGAGKVLGSASLNREAMTYYDGQGYKDDDSRRLPLNAFDMGFVPGTLTAWLAAGGSDALFRIDFNSTYKEKTIDSFGGGKTPYIDLVPGAVREDQMGRMPVGVVVTSSPHPATGTRRFAFAAADVSRNLVAIDLDRQEIAGLTLGKPAVAMSAAQPTEAKAVQIAAGKRDYYNGLGRWSLNGQGWGACHTCHADGLSDNVTWFAPRGPRQAQSLDGLYSSKDPNDMRIHGWSGILDEVTDHEIAGIRGAIGGIGALVKDMNIAWSSALPLAEVGQGDLYGSSSSLLSKSASDDWQKIIAYLQNIRSPRRPSNLDPALVKTGRELFLAANCNGCHGGDKWTMSSVFYEPKADQTTNNALRTLSWSAAAKSSGLPESVLPSLDPAKQVMRSNVADPELAAVFDVLSCSLRNVKTWGVAEPDVGVSELRFTMDVSFPAQGDAAADPVTGLTGYNPPSLMGANLGAPYFHAGQARTLEAVLSDRFKGHHQALAPDFLKADDPQRAQKLAALVQFVLAIDEDMETTATPPLGPKGGVLCKAP